MNTLLIFFAAMFYVATRALQQRNVQHDNYWWVMPTSLLMSCLDVLLVVYISRTGWHWKIVLANGLGAGIGCLAAMLFHKRFIMRRVK